MKIRINFADFWPGFVKENNYFINLLKKHYEVELSDDPEILFYSCYGKSYLNYKCIRVFYSAENLRPDFSGCDFALTFDYNNNPRHFRLPLYGIYIEQKNMLPGLLMPKTKEQAREIWNKKTKFCCMVVSNPHSQKRIRFFHALNKHKPVDSGGRYLNNVGGPVANKLDFINEYKFVIAFENSAYPGYTTEKILEPLFVDSIPIYWGNPQVGNDFNTKAFINYSDFRNEEEMIRRIIEISDNEEQGIEMLMQPKFPGNQLPPYIDESNVMAFLGEIITKKEQIRPVALSPIRLVHSLGRRKRLVKSAWNRVFGKNFR